ncbi:hypothetical protein DPMN_068356 [Dreissena polymorpha]|uniref:Uncharacterized protein n=1 Tax=Dreissena polymorpha TaxID=45954 RepID=A0A9D3Z239_DREPO|nr:hypothetical protein DPMN_068356 [Dreissena polymorpha]
MCRAPKPWFNENILDLKRKTRKLERMWRKYKQPDLYELFKIARNKYTFELNAEKQRSLSQKVIDFHGGSKKLYKFVSELTGKNTDNPMPEGESDAG